MAKKIYTDKINKHTDWGGDKSTKNLPVSGERVQEFIKETFDQKVGLLYFDPPTNKYFAFADEESRDIYLKNRDSEDPEIKKLLLGFFDATLNYEAKIKLVSNTSNIIVSGNGNTRLKFIPDIINKDKVTAGDNVRCTITITNSGTVKTIKGVYLSGEEVDIELTDYLSVGTNNVIINIVGITTMASTSSALSYKIVNIDLSDEYDLSNRFILKEDTKTQLEIPFNVKGVGVVTMEWYVDGHKLDLEESVDIITAGSASKFKYVDISDFLPGRHTIQYRATITIDDVLYGSAWLYREFITYKEFFEDKDYSVIAFKTYNPDVIDSYNNIKLNGTQYEDLILKMSASSYNNKSNVDVKVSYEDETEVLKTPSNTTMPLIITPKSTGEVDVTITIGDDTRTIVLNTKESEYKVTEIEDELVLKLSAKGRNNTSDDKDTWSFKDINTKFNNFNWLSNGWINNSLVLDAGCSIDINYKPFGINPTIKGKTIELELGADTAGIDDVVMLDLIKDNRGLLITSNEAKLTASSGATVSTKFKSGEINRLSFVINRPSGTADKRLMFIYVNGINCGACRYVPNDSFITDKLLNISVPDDSMMKVYIKNISIYDKALNDDEILMNYIATRSDIKEKVRLITRNDIIDPITRQITPDKVKNFMPVMIVTGNIPKLEATKNKKEAITVDVEYINVQEPELSFKLKGAKMTPQGTSSMTYPKKNFRIYSDKYQGTIMYDSENNIVKDKKYAFKKGAIPVKAWCLKADYAESSSSHNTGVARIWNDVLRDAKITKFAGDGNGTVIEDESGYYCRTKAQQINKLIVGKNKETGEEELMDCQFRTTVDGFPIVLFYKPTSNATPIFIGKYNFNNDKSTEEVFGFKNVYGLNSDTIQCWEFRDNGNGLALFNDVSNFDEDVKKTFEGRFPKDNTNTDALRELATWIANVSQEDFATQKWEHFNVYNLAAYYIYLMRFGAVDQVVKNSMITTEDLKHWHFINYDNDTIMGVRNDGYLKFPPTIDRQSIDYSYNSGNINSSILYTENMIFDSEYDNSSSERKIFRLTEKLKVNNNYTLVIKINKIEESPTDISVKLGDKKIGSINTLKDVVKVLRIIPESTSDIITIESEKTDSVNMDKIIPWVCCYEGKLITPPLTKVYSQKETGNLDNIKNKISLEITQKGYMVNNTIRDSDNDNIEIKFKVYNEGNDITDIAVKNKCVDIYYRDEYQGSVDSDSFIINPMMILKTKPSEPMQLKFYVNEEKLLAIISHGINMYLERNFNYQGYKFVPFDGSSSCYVKAHIYKDGIDITSQCSPLKITAKGAGGYIKSENDTVTFNAEDWRDGTPLFVELYDTTLGDAPLNVTEKITNGNDSEYVRPNILRLHSANTGSLATDIELKNTSLKVTNRSRAFRVFFDVDLKKEKTYLLSWEQDKEVNQSEDVWCMPSRDSVIPDKNGNKRSCKLTMTNDATTLQIPYMKNVGEAITFTNIKLEEIQEGEEELPTPFVENVEDIKARLS